MNKLFRDAFPDEPEMERLLLLCYVLSQASGNGEFRLSVSTAMTLCGFVEPKGYLRTVFFDS